LVRYPCQLVLRCAAFFFEKKKGILDDFRAISSGGDVDEFHERWGWYELIFSLAGEDILKMDQVTKLPIRQVFTHLAYVMDREGKKNEGVG
jgi:hypothetical protein